MGASKEKTMTVGFLLNKNQSMAEEKTETVTKFPCVAG